jgi:hypothetical protein
VSQGAAEVGEGDIHIVVVACPSTAESSKGVMLPEARSIGRVTAVTWQVGVEAEEGHGGGGWGGGVFE